MVWVAQESFANGEISPSLFGLVSSQQYQSGCQTLVNALLTPTGAAVKRHGTHHIMGTTSDYTTAIFSYFAKGKQFVIEVSSQDDDPGDLNTAQRQLRVIDATTGAFVNVGDNRQHGPFDAYGDNTAYYHHFTASELPFVYSFQDNERLYLCHPDRPPLYLEREVGEGGVETWLYGIAPASGRTPRVVDYQLSANVTSPTPSTLEADLPIFDKRDEGAYWRYGGAENGNPQVDIYGSWFRTDTFKTQEKMDGVRLYGDGGSDGQDWTGPYTLAGTAFDVTLQTNSDQVNQSVVVDFVSATIAYRNWVGLPILINNVLFIVTAVAANNQITCVRLGGGSPLLDFPEVYSAQLLAIGADPNIFSNEYLEQRPYLVRHPIGVSGTTGTITLTSSWGFLQQDISSGDGDIPWLPDGHEETFDRIGNTAIGGTVHLNSGIVAITGVNTTAGPGGLEVIYTGTVIKTLAHQGPSFQYGLGMSNAVGFPSAGTTHQGRVWLGGFKERPSRVVASRVFDRDDFVVGSLDDDPLALELSDPLGGRVTWMESAADLLVGTTTSEFAIGGRPITATNLAVERQSAYGSKNIRPALVGGSALFVDNGGKGIREMSFVDSVQRYESPDLTDLAKHIFEDITLEQIVYVSSPEQVVYVRDSNHKLYALSYWRQHGVAGWSRFTQPSWPINSGASQEDSTIESMCVVRADGVNILKDEVWLVRRFTIGGQVAAGTTVRQIERMTPDYEMDQTRTDTNPTSTTFSAGTPGLDYISQPDVQLRLRENATDDYVYMGDFTTGPTGTIVYADVGFTPDQAEMGRQVRFNMVPVTPHFPTQGVGDSQGRLENISTALILLRNSRGGTVGDGVKAGTLMPPGVVIPNASNPSTPIAALTEWRKALSVGVFGSMARLEIVQTEPYHFEVAGINMQLTHGK